MFEPKFEDIYKSFRLNTIHRYFKGTDESLIAVFTLFELLHNFREAVDYANGKESENNFIEKWYSHELDIIKARPEVYGYIFGRKCISEKRKKQILANAKKEFLQILEMSGLNLFFGEGKNVIQEIKAMKEKCHV